MFFFEFFDLDLCDPSPSIFLSKLAKTFPKQIGYAYAHLRAFFEDFTALAETVDEDSIDPPRARGVLDEKSCEQCK